MISKQQVQHIAKLARISLTKKEEEKFQKELSSILDYVEKLKGVEAKNVEPFFQSLVQNFSLKEEKLNLLRKDEVKEEESETVKKLIEAMPEKKERYLKVKTVFNQNGAS